MGNNYAQKPDYSDNRISIVFAGSAFQSSEKGEVYVEVNLSLRIRALVSMPKNMYNESGLEQFLQAMDYYQN